MLSACASVVATVAPSVLMNTLVLPPLTTHPRWLALSFVATRSVVSTSMVATSSVNVILAEAAKLGEWAGVQRKYPPMPPQRKAKRKAKPNFDARAMTNPLEKRPLFFQAALATAPKNLLLPARQRKSPA
jgi:hypothetical protein